ncbi:hypothetical protein Pat9b_3922 [Pantoea sp. At-9b]|nr:hypothetical protein Pat9b_3922 [Pantoea sp. At-9b]
MVFIQIKHGITPLHTAAINNNNRNVPIWIAQLILYYRKKNSLRSPDGFWLENIIIKMDFIVIWRIFF